MPSSMYDLLSFKSSPAIKVTDVVPSPTSLSWDLAISTRVLAAGCAISNKLKIVAPSLLIVVLLF